MTRDDWLGPDHRLGGAGDRLEGVCRACVLDAGVDGAGLTVTAGDGTPETVFATGTVAAQVEDLQFTLGEGPCVEAVRTGEAVLAPHLGMTGHDRWPAFGREAAAMGVGAVFALPVRFGAASFGALGLHRSSPGPLDRHQLASAIQATDAAAGLLAAATSDGLDGVVPALTYRMVVHQAAGMAMVQLGTSLPDALVRLRATAFAEGITINDLATDLVSRRRRLAREEA